MPSLPSLLLREPCNLKFEELAPMPFLVVFACGVRVLSSTGQELCKKDMVCVPVFETVLV
jgi:hypothetical protein